jgi:hypothetical protein
MVSRAGALRPLTMFGGDRHSKVTVAFDLTYRLINGTVSLLHRLSQPNRRELIRGESENDR